jgi:3',5'-nucleoside bisphosphate phosphatase
MKVELHCHTSRYSQCALNTPRELMQKFVRTGYDAVYITEHMALWRCEELEELRAEFPTLRIFPGIEWTIADMPLQHVVIPGANNPAYLKITEWKDCLRLARQEGHLTVLAHPFRWEGAGTALAGPDLPDAIEYRTCNHHEEPGRTALETAGRLNLPLVNAGDTHGLKFIDRFYIQTQHPIEQADDIRSIILEGEYRNGGEASAAPRGEQDSVAIE